LVVCFLTEIVARSGLSLIASPLILKWPGPPSQLKLASCLALLADLREKIIYLVCGPNCKIVMRLFEAIKIVLQASHFCQDCL